MGQRTRRAPGPPKGPNPHVLHINHFQKKSPVSDIFDGTPFQKPAQSWKNHPSRPAPYRLPAPVASLCTNATKETGMSFDEIVDRHGTHSMKWDMMEKLYGVPADDGIPMWVADMDFPAPDCIQDAVQRMRDHGIYGYYGDDAAYRAAICWWMENRHGWTVDPAAIFTTHGLVNGTAMCVDTFTQPGDGVVLTTPVYHAFAKVIKANDRRVIECDLVNNDGRYEMDFDAWDAQMDGSARMFILCSPHNPGGRVWTQSELAGVADFCRRHDLILVSDEIHHDL
jgi:cystathionine beta-lyase